jgi:opacity protein-like surface antigen
MTSGNAETCNLLPDLLTLSGNSTKRPQTMINANIASHSLSCSPLVLVAALSVTLSAGAAQGELYVRSGIGPAFAKDTELERFFTAPVNNNKVELETGFHFDVAIGYPVIDWFAVEAEIGLTDNVVKSVQGTSDDDLGFTQAPFLINVVLQLPNETGLVPFIGGGGGGSVNAIYADDFTLGGVRFDGSDADVTYAYQAFGGLRYDFDPRMSVNVMYKYVVTGDSSWEADVSFGGSSRAEINGFCTHTVVAAFTYRF